MSVSPDYINSLLQRFLDSGDGAKAVRDHIGKYGVSGVDLSEVNELVNDMIIDLQHRLRAVIPGFDVQAVHATPAVADKNGRITVKITIDNDALWRDSLTASPSSAETSGWKRYATKNGRLGTDNIVLQFAKGWDTDGKSVFGNWHGNYVQSTYRREPNDFLISAVNEFNRSAPKGVRAELEEKYR